MSGFYWLASYPKSGNTWLRLALHSLLAPRNPIDFRQPITFAPVATSREEFESALGIQSADLTNDEIERLRPTVWRRSASGTPQFRKVHDTWTVTADGPLFPPDVTLGTIYMVRDPRDVAISLAHFLGVTVDEATGRLARDVGSRATLRQRLPIQLPYRSGTWSSHVESWLDAPGRPPCVVRYEDMLADPHGELHRIADYASIPVTAETIAAAVAATRFQRLADAEALHGFNEASVSAPFFRSGRAGAWREGLSRVQADRVVRDHERVMRRAGYL